MGTQLASDSGELRVPIVSSYLHGYGISFRVWFEGDLDERNWVWDFGGMKRAKGTIDGMNPKAWMDHMFDHTTIIAEDDPHLPLFKVMHIKGLIQLRIIPATGAEQFAKYIYEKLNLFIQEETKGRVRVAQVEFMEHNKNTAIYKSLQNIEKLKELINKHNMYTKTTTEDVKMMSLYEYLGRAAGSDLGKLVYAAASKERVSVETHEVATPNYTGKILRYPKTFLDGYFKNK